MKKIMLKALGLVMAVFAASQLLHVEKAHAKSAPKITGQKTAGKTIHDTGCNCVSCMQSATQGSTTQAPSDKKGLSTKR